MPSPVSEKTSPMCTGLSEPAAAMPWAGSISTFAAALNPATLHGAGHPQALVVADLPDRGVLRDDVQLDVVQRDAGQGAADVRRDAGGHRRRAEGADDVHQRQVVEGDDQHALGGELRS